MSKEARFRQAGIPSALADEILQFSEEHPWLGYRSLSSFVTSGARKLLQEARQEVYRKHVMEAGDARGSRLEHSDAGAPREVFQGGRM